MYSRNSTNTGQNDFMHYTLYVSNLTESGHSTIRPNRRVGHLPSWPIRQLPGWPVGRLASWPVGRPSSWPVDQTATGTLRWEVGRLASWPAGHLRSLFSSHCCHRRLYSFLNTLMPLSCLLRYTLMFPTSRKLPTCQMAIRPFDQLASCQLTSWPVDQLASCPISQLSG